MAVNFEASSGYSISLLGQGFNSTNWQGGTGANRYMIVIAACLRSGGGTSVPSSATYDGQTMTKQYGLSSLPLDFAVFTLANPNSGTGKTLSVSVPNDRDAAWAVGGVYNGVDLTDPIHVQDSYNGSGTMYGTGLQVTTTLPGRRLVTVGAFRDGTNSASAISPSTERRENSSGSSTTDDGGGWLGDYAPVTTGTYTGSILLTSSNKLVGGMFALNPAADGAAAVIMGL